MATSTAPNQHILVLGLAAAAAISLILWQFSRQRASASEPKALTPGSDDDKDLLKPSRTSGAAAKKPATSDPSSKVNEKEIHSKIETLDKKGKELYSKKQYLEAAQVFTEALDLVKGLSTEGSSSLQRQYITLMNNRSAMYEKGGLPELALEDCDAILEKELEHDKARKRRLRTLEGLKRWFDALIEVCALQLLFMKANRANAAMGLPLPPPPVPQSKIEELMTEILPSEVEKYASKLKEQKKRSLPSKFTILQLLKTYAGYNSWMAQAAREGSVEKITAELPEAGSDPASKAQRAAILMKRGRRRVHDKEYALASKDFEEAYALVEKDTQVQEAMEDDSYARLLEWTGMVRHWHYELDSALACYQKCADLEPTNHSLLVKQAGVQMDAGRHEESLKLFDTSLGLDPNAVDALLHRSNLKMLKGKPEEAKEDLLKCLSLRPNFVTARLRLTSILAALNDPEGAKQQLDLAEREEPNSGEVQSYRGELAFTQGQMQEAKDMFEKAIELEPSNPTPYVNTAMTILNAPPAVGQMPDIAKAIELLEKAIEVDPQFTVAYVQLGQLVLGTATTLAKAQEVVGLYDRALANCRTQDEIKELCSMRLLAVAQVEAASMLKMEAFSMQ